MTIIPEGYGQATIFFSGAGAPLGAATTFGFANPTDKGAAQLANNVEASWVTAMIPKMSSALTQYQVQIKLGPNDEGATAENNDVNVGTAAATAVSPNVAWLVDKVTALGGRRHKGRMFVPGLVEGDVSASGIITGSGYQTAVDDLYDFLVADDINMVILHNSVGTPTPVTSLSSNAKVGTLRRRLRH